MSTTAVNIADLRQKAKLPAKQAGGGTVAAFFEQNKQSLAAVLPRHVDADRLLKVALGALRTTPKLMECTTESLFGAVVQLAQLGLEPNTPLGHAYLIPFVNRAANRTDVQVIIGYRGLIDLARRSGQIVSIAAHAVHERDRFDFAYGLDEKLEQRPALGNRGEIIAFYAVAKLTNGGHAFEVMTRDEIDAIRDASQGYRSAVRFGKKDHPWQTAYTEMGRKTVIRRLFKYLPVSIELATAAALDSLAEAEKPQHLETALAGEWSVVADNEAPVVDETTAPALEAQAEPVTAEPEWPRRQGEEWIDSAGEVFDSARHGWSRELDRPSTTSDGRFRSRRGANGAGPQTEPTPAPAATQNDFEGLE